MSDLPVGDTPAPDPLPDPLPEQPAPVTEPTPAAAPVPDSVPSDHVVLATAFPHNEFNHGLEDVPPITSAGTPVPKRLVEELRDLAHGLGVHLKELS